MTILVTTSKFVSNSAIEKLLEERKEIGYSIDSRSQASSNQRNGR